jgi:hypothetical protein
MFKENIFVLYIFTTERNLISINGYYFVKAPNLINEGIRLLQTLGKKVEKSEHFENGAFKLSINEIIENNQLYKTFQEGDHICSMKVLSEFIKLKQRLIKKYQRLDSSLNKILGL